MYKPSLISSQKGFSLIEVVCTLVFITVALGGFYQLIITASQQLATPEKTMVGINLLEFHQHKIESHCQRPVDVERDCPVTGQPATMSIAIDQRFEKYDAYELVLVITPHQAKGLAQLEYTLYYQNKKLLVSKRWGAL